MGKKTTVFVRTSGATRGTATGLAMAAVVVALTSMILLPQRADTQESFAADSDGYVPVHDVCFAGSEVGYYSWYNDGYTTYGEISIDTCLLDSYGAGPADYDRVLAHEQGHAAGLGHSSDPNDIMYPYTHIFQGGAQVEAPAQAEQYGEPETEQYEEPAEAEQYEEPEQPMPKDEQYALDLSSEVQQYEPGQESDAAEQAPAVREAPREERPPLRTNNEEERKQAEDSKKAEERKKAEKLDETVDRVRAEAAALSQAVDGADALTEEEIRNRAEALARTLEDEGVNTKDGPLAEARTAAKDMVASLTRIGVQAEDPAVDRVQAVAETREKAVALAGALDRAGDNARGDARAKDFDEASADVRAVASKLVGAETELKDQEAEGQKVEDRNAEGQPSEVRNAAGQDAEQGVFTRIKEFLARTFA